MNIRHMGKLSTCKILIEFLKISIYTLFINEANLPITVNKSFTNIVIILKWQCTLYIYLVN